MVTAEDIINSALSKIGVRNREVPLTDNQISDSIDELNDMMTQWDSDGIALGYTIISDKDDTITTPDWSHAAMKSNLGGRLAPAFGQSISGTLGAQIINDFKSLQDRVTETPEIYFPDTLPVGSGNNIDNFSVRSNFFVDESYDDILTGNDQLLQDDEGDQLEQDRSIEGDG